MAKLADLIWKNAELLRGAFKETESGGGQGQWPAGRPAAQGTPAGNGLNRKSS